MQLNTANTNLRWVNVCFLHHNRWEFYDSTSNLKFLTAIHKKSRGQVMPFRAESTHVWHFESLERFKLSCRWRRELVQRSQDHSVQDVLENNLFAVYLGNSSRPFVRFQSSCSNQPSPPLPPPKK